MTEVYESFYELKVNGREVLLVDEKKYTYKKARGYSGAKLVFACSEAADHECPCKITVQNNKVVWRTVSHNHFPNEFSLGAKEMMSRLWHAATETQCDINELLGGMFAEASPMVLIYLPEIDRLSSNLKAARRAAAKKRGECVPKSQSVAGRKRKAEDNDKENLAQSENTAVAPQEEFTKFELLQDQPAQAEKGEIQTERTPKENQQGKREIFPEAAPPAVKKLKMVPDADSGSE